MISDDVKANVKQQKNWWVCPRNFYNKYLQNLKYNVKRAYIFLYFWLVFYPA